MSGFDPQRVEALFCEAAELPHEQRGAFLKAACAGDEALRREVETLLAHDQAAPVRFLGGDERDAVRVGECVGDMVGRYRLEALIGEGGFGMVYRAHQSEPVRRDVAVKIIKAGMDTRRVVARFEAERQTLANLNHPNTTRVLDAGVTERGLPYFVMELVEGEPITSFCRSAELPLNDRLDLFRQTCAAVQHAHQRAIIHRDIKPSNVMVQRVDGAPMVKVIDFGIARALDPSGEPAVSATVQGAVIGTPEYMSPEQASGAAMDTRTDVYSLGVLLYELLTDAHPFAEQLSRATDVTERLRLVQELEPARPSTKLREREGARADDRDRQHRRIRGDLDWIVMRAMEKDPGRRYASVADLAADIRRHQDDEPVEAGPPSRVYRAGKFLRRHRVGLGAAAVVALGLAIGVVGLATGLSRATEEATRARREATRATQVATLLKDLIGGVDPAVTRGRDAPVLREILASASARIDERLRDEPLVEAELRHTIAETQFAIGAYEEALENHRRAHGLRLASLGASHHDTVSSASGVATALNYLGRHDEAAASLEDALAPWMSDDFAQARVSAEIHVLGQIYRDQGRLEEALAMMRKAMGLRSGEDPDLASLRRAHDVASLYARMERYEEAERLHREIYERRLETLGKDHPDTLYSMNALAYLYGSQGRFEEGEPFYRETLEGRRRVLGADHPDTLTSMNNLAFLYARIGRLGDAESLFREALAEQRRTLGPVHPAALLTLNNIGAVLALQGRPEEADPCFVEAYEGRRAALGADHHYTLFSAHRLGQNRREMSRPEDAAHFFSLAAEGRRRTLGAAHADTVESMEQLVIVLASLGRREEAEEFVRARAADLGESDSSAEILDRLRGALDPPSDESGNAAD